MKKKNLPALALNKSGKSWQKLSKADMGVAKSSQVEPLRDKLRQVESSCFPSIPIDSMAFRGENK